MEIWEKWTLYGEEGIRPPPFRLNSMLGSLANNISYQYASIQEGWTYVLTAATFSARSFLPWSTDCAKINGASKGSRKKWYPRPLGANGRDLNQELPKGPPRPNNDLFHSFTSDAERGGGRQWKFKARRKSQGAKVGENVLSGRWCLFRVEETLKDKINGWKKKHSLDPPPH